MKKVSLLMIVLLILSLPVITGCGGFFLGGGTSIRGQVVLNGAGTNHVTLFLVANGKIYGGDSVASDGSFSHANQGYDSEFCVPGTHITFYFNSTDPGAFAETSIVDYVVTGGINDLGKIEIGVKGLTLTAPDDDATILSWPADFSWNEYTGVSSGCEYSMNLKQNSFFGHLNLWSSSSNTATSCQLAGDESDYLDSAIAWDVTVYYQKNGLNFSATTQERSITLTPPG